MQKAGPFVQNSATPLVLTHPYVRYLREAFLKRIVDAQALPSPPSSSDSPGDKEEKDEMDAVDAASSDSQQGWSRQKVLLKLQREARAQLLKEYIECAKRSAVRIHPIETINADNFMQSQWCYLLPYKQHARTKKQYTRDVKTFEKNDRRKKNEAEDRKRRKTHEFHKLLMSQRDDFLRFHKSRRSGHHYFTLPNRHTYIHKYIHTYIPNLNRINTLNGSSTI